MSDKKVTLTRDCRWSNNDEANYCNRTLNSFQYEEVATQLDQFTCAFKRSNSQYNSDLRYDTITCTGYLKPRADADDVSSKRKDAVKTDIDQEVTLYEFVTEPSFNLGLSPRAGHMYLNNTKAFGGNEDYVTGYSYDLVFRPMMVWGKGIARRPHKRPKDADDKSSYWRVSNDAYYLGPQVGLGGISVVGNDEGTFGVFHSGLVFEAYPSCPTTTSIEACTQTHTKPGVRTYVGYVMPFKTETLGHGIQAELQLDLPDGIDIGPFGQYYPDTGTWGLGIMLGWDVFDTLDFF